MSKSNKVNQPEEANAQKEYLELILAYILDRSTVANDLPGSLAWLADEPEAEAALRQLEELLAWQDDPAWLEDIAAASAGVVTPAVAELLRDYKLLTRLLPGLIERFNMLRQPPSIDESQLLPSHPTFAEQFRMRASSIQNTPVIHRVITGIDQPLNLPPPNKTKPMPETGRRGPVKRRRLRQLHPLTWAAALLATITFVGCWLSILLVTTQFFPANQIAWWVTPTAPPTARAITILPTSTPIPSPIDLTPPRPSASSPTPTSIRMTDTATPTQLPGFNLPALVSPSPTPVDIPDSPTLTATPSSTSTLTPSSTSTPTPHPVTPFQTPTPTHLPPSPPPTSTPTRTVTILAAETITGLNATNSSPTPLGQTTTLTATLLEGSNISYTWSFGDETQGSGRGAVVTYTYPAAGVYTAVVTASNSVNVITATTLITITPQPLTTLTVANDSPTPLGQATALTATLATTSPVSYTWSFGDGTSALNSSAAITHIYPDRGVYTPVITASTSMSLITATTTVTIMDEAITGFNVINDSPTLLGQATTLTATLTTGSHVNYDWSFGDTSQISGNNAVITHTYPITGIYTAVVTASNTVSVVTATTTLTIIGSHPSAE